MIETFTIVAFRYDQKRSVLYQNKDDPQAIARMVLKALIDEKADVISIRRVMEKHPEQLEVKYLKLRCEKCGKTWKQDINPVEPDVWSVIQAIIDSHRYQSPNCDGDRYNIKLLES